MMRPIILILLTVCVFFDAAAQFPPRDLQQELRDLSTPDPPPPTVCQDGTRPLFRDDCPPPPSDAEFEAAAAAGAAAPADPSALLAEQASAALAGLSPEDRRRFDEWSAEQEAQRRLREQEALREAEYRERFRSDGSVDLVGGNWRDQLARAAWVQERARLEVGDCQARNDEPALADAVRKARLDAISNPDRVTLSELAYALSNAKQYDAAISEFERALAAKDAYREPSANLFLGRAQALANLGRLKQAFADLDRAVSPQQVALFREQLQGRAAVAKGDYAAAIRHLEKAIELKPSDDSDLKLELAETYWHAGRRTDAIAKVDEAINQVSTEQAADVSAGRVSIFIAAWDERVKRFCPPQ